MSRNTFGFGARLAVVLVIVGTACWVWLSNRTTSILEVANDEPHQELESIATAAKKVPVIEVKAADLQSTSTACRIVEGNGPSKGIAAVVAAKHGESDIFIMDEGGAFLANTVEYIPNNIQFGRRGDGSIVYGVADLRLNSKSRRESSTDEPLRVFHDSTTIYESQKVLDFGVANDGTSFFVIEPMAGGTAMLVLRNLETGIESHYDLASDWAPQSDELGFSATYSAANDSVMVLPSDPTSSEDRRFYSTQANEVRRVKPPGNMVTLGSAVSSSNAGYFATPGENGITRISKIRFDGESNHESPVVWRREIKLEKFYGSLDLSDDARWLLVGAWNTLVLDANSGATVFKWPIAGGPDKERERLQSVMPAQDAAEAEIGAVSNISITDGQLLMTRKIGMSAFKTCHLDADPKSCFEAAKRQVRIVVDVFDMATIDEGSSPNFRIDTTEMFGCVTDRSAIGTLALDDEAGVVYRKRNAIVN